MSEVGVVLMAYGTPRDRSEIAAYYTDIRRGHPPTDEQLADLTRRYDAIGGTSPLAAITESQGRALGEQLDALTPGRYQVVLGFKHTAPRIEDAVAAAGTSRLVGLVLAPHYSTASVGEYHRRAAGAADALGASYAAIDSWATEPALVEFLASDLERRLAAMPERTRVLFTAHSLPERIVQGGDPYADEVRATADDVAGRLGLGDRWSTAWQSAGRTRDVWLGPDVLEVIARFGDDPDVDGVVVCACGFVADHLEVLYDLDIEAARRAAECGLAFDRTASVNDDPGVIAALAGRVHAAAG